MTPPKPRCVQCMDIIEEYDTHSLGTTPKFCLDPDGTKQCREWYRLKPICGRCRLPLPRRGDPGFAAARRYHESCRLGCAFCGGGIPEPSIEPQAASSTRERRQLPTYCSRDCRDSAWQGQPMPTCPACGETVDFEPKAHVWRNPPLYHGRCNPTSRSARRGAMKKNQDSKTFFIKLWVSKYRVPLRLAERFPPPFEKATALNEPLPIDPLGRQWDEQYWMGEVWDGAEYGWDHDHVPRLYLTEHELEQHPYHPGEPRIPRYDLEWRTKQEHWSSNVNPYSAKYAMNLPWTDKNYPILNYPNNYTPYWSVEDTDPDTEYVDPHAPKAVPRKFTKDQHREMHQEEPDPTCRWCEYEAQTGITE
jgi:hypothetical protein